MANVRVHPGKSVEGRAKAQKIADRTGKPVTLLQPFSIPTRTGRMRTGWTAYDTVYPRKSNPSFPSLFKKYYVTVDGKKFGPYRTMAKAKKVAVTVARVLDKPAKIMGAAQAKVTNPKRRAKYRRHNPDRKWTIAAIKSANRDAGYYFFSRDTMKFFGTKIYPTVYQGPGGVFFVTREMPPSGNPIYKVRKFAESGNVTTYAEANYADDAKSKARAAAR